MSSISFEWDERKSRSNKRKHGISFDEATTAFSDEAGLILDDPDESKDHDRYVLLGFSAALRLLVVCHCYQANDDVIRIISARKAERSEKRTYSDRWK